MALRFHRRIKIAPGIKVNVGLKGVSSATIGRRGASINVGKKNVHLSAGLPGTGLSTRTKISGTKPQDQSDQPVVKKSTNIRDYFFGFIGLATIVGILIWIF